MKIIIGLGNIGEKYTHTRHNTGFLFIDSIIRTSQVKSQRISSKLKSELIEINFHSQDFLLVKPQTLMNESGLAVRAIIDFYKYNIEDLLVVHDDLDLRIGEYKTQFAKGPKQHNGIQSIERQLNTKNFSRLRVGVDNRNLENRINGESYVLMSFSREEEALLNTVFLQCLTIVKDF